MQTYKYSAISRAGSPVNGVVEAVDEYAAVAKIRETCTTITKIQAVKEKSTSTTGMDDAGAPELIPAAYQGEGFGRYVLPVFHHSGGRLAGGARH